MLLAGRHAVQGFAGKSVQVPLWRCRRDVPKPLIQRVFWQPPAVPGRLAACIPLGFVSSRGESAYQYSVAAGTTLADYNMEQQGDIISDYYMIVVLGEPRYARGSRGTPEQLRMVLADFLRDPSSRDNLPRSR